MSDVVMGQRPTKGRTVLYLLDNPSRIVPLDPAVYFEPWPAVVMRHLGGGRCDLYVMTVAGGYPVPNVRFGSMTAPGTWHWPPREPRGVRDAWATYEDLASTSDGWPSPLDQPQTMNPERDTVRSWILAFFHGK